MNIYRLLLIVLSLISAWLYLRVVLPPEPVAPVITETTGETPPGKGGPQTAAAINAEVPVAAASETASQLETIEANPAETTPVAPEVAISSAELQPLPG